MTARWRPDMVLSIESTMAHPKRGSLQLRRWVRPFVRRRSASDQRRIVKAFELMYKKGINAITSSKST